jgi:hypothetical protein
MTSPDLLLERLGVIAQALAARPDAIALLGLGSVGRELDRLDEHSDLDFFVIVDDDAKQRYLEDIDWLEDAAPVVYDFENTVDGRKILFADGIYAEYAVFTIAEAASSASMPGRVVWQRPDAPEGLGDAGKPPTRPPLDTPEFQLDEALTNLYVGLHRDARGERLSGMRLIQVHAIDRLLTYLDLTGESVEGQRDAFAVERRAESRLGPSFPFAQTMRGYEHNRESALAVLDWIESRATVSAVLAAKIRELAGASSGS